MTNRYSRKSIIAEQPSQHAPTQQPGDREKFFVKPSYIHTGVVYPCFRVPTHSLESLVDAIVLPWSTLHKILTALRPSTSSPRISSATHDMSYVNLYNGVSLCRSICNYTNRGLVVPQSLRRWLPSCTDWPELCSPKLRAEVATTLEELNHWKERV